MEFALAVHFSTFAGLVSMKMTKTPAKEVDFKGFFKSVARHFHSRVNFLILKAKIALTAPSHHHSAFSLGLLIQYREDLIVGFLALPQLKVGGQ